jgi:hypothetical protein
MEDDVGHRGADVNPAKGPLPVPEAVPYRLERRRRGGGPRERRPGNAPAEDRPLLGAKVVAPHVSTRWPSSMTTTFAIRSALLGVKDEGEHHLGVIHALGGDVDKTSLAETKGADGRVEGFRGNGERACEAKVRLRQPACVSSACLVPCSDLPSDTHLTLAQRVQPRHHPRLPSSRPPPSTAPPPENTSDFSAPQGACTMMSSIVASEHALVLARAPW